MKNYKSVVKQIKNLNWRSLDENDLQRLMILSYHSAREFANSLRLTLRLHPENRSLQAMAQEELKTDNLAFRDYHGKGDHSDFLWHFNHKYELPKKHPDVLKAGLAYETKVNHLPQKVRVMSIVSREQELPGIFKQILTAPSWQAPGLPEFQYYLQQHIFLDSREGGHADMLSEFPINNRVADFYNIRLDMYKAIPKLFKRKR